MQKITPWEVSGKINYERLIKEFGLTALPSKLPEVFKNNILVNIKYVIFLLLTVKLTINIIR